MTGDDTGQWLTLAELAERSGRDRTAVRSWVRRRHRAGQVRTQRNNRGETQVWATPELLAELGQDRDPADGLAETWPTEEMAELRHALGRAEGELTAELRHNVDLAATLAAERARADRLEAALAEARRPWLAKVIEGLRRKGS
jgi:hypothetical protein